MHPFNGLAPMIICSISSLNIPPSSARTVRDCDAVRLSAVLSGVNTSRTRSALILNVISIYDTRRGDGGISESLNLPRLFLFFLRARLRLKAWVSTPSRIGRVRG
jgi:hypothetical protein